MATYESLDNLLYIQSMKLKDLERTTDIIKNKNLIQEELFHAYKEINYISNKIQQLKQDIKIMKQDNKYCNELATILKSVHRQIQHMENNIPSKIKEYINYDLPTNSDNQYPNEKNLYTSLNNITIISSDNKSNDNIVEDLKRCKKILFNDLETSYIHEIIKEEYNRIPKYIIGRHTLETLNNLVSNINQIIKAKYSTIALGKNGARKKGELDLYLHYKKEQISLGIDEENTFFFTSDDYEKYIKAKLDKTKLNLLIALRHCKRIREIRTAKTVNYAIINSSL